MEPQELNNQNMSNNPSQSPTSAISSTLSASSTASASTVSSSKPPKSKALIATSIICGILAVAGITFGVYEFLESNQKSQQISDLETKLTAQNSTTSQSPQSTIETVNYPDTELAERVCAKYNGNGEYIAEGYNSSTTAVGHYICETTDSMRFYFTIYDGSFKNDILTNMTYQEAKEIGVGNKSDGFVVLSVDDDSFLGYDMISSTNYLYLTAYGNTSIEIKTRSTEQAEAILTDFGYLN